MFSLLAPLLCGISHDYILKSVWISEDCQVRGLNNGGIVVGQVCDAEGNRRGFFWSEDLGLAKLNAPAGLDTDATGINKAGDVSGGFVDASGVTRACVWWKGQQFQDLQLPFGARSSLAVGVSDDGTVFGNYVRHDSSASAFRYHPLLGTIPIEMPKGYTESQVVRVGNSGAYTGIAKSMRGNGANVGFRYTSKGLEELFLPNGGSQSQAHAINRFGDVGGSGNFNGTIRPVVWFADGAIQVSTLPPGYSQGEALGINFHGDTVGALQPDDLGYVREDHGMVDLNLGVEPSSTRQVVNRAVDFNDVGQILAQSGGGAVLLRPVVVQWTEADQIDLLRGRVSYGHRGGLRLVDREPMTIESTATRVSESEVIDFVTESPSTFITPHDITFRLVVREKLPEQATLLVEMYDWSENRYDFLDRVSVDVPKVRFGLIDYRCSGDVRRYQRSGDRMLRARVRVFGPTVKHPWAIELDQMVWIVR